MTSQRLCATNRARIGVLILGFGFILTGVLCVVPLSAQSAATAKAPAQAASAPSANDEIIKLAMAGMDESVLLAKVAATDKSKFDTSADGLLKLKSAGVSQRVIAAILGAVPPVAAPELTVPPAMPFAAPATRFAPSTSTGGPVSAASVALTDGVPVPDASALGVPPSKYFTIFISAPQRNGFFDTTKDIQDTIKDLRERLAKEKDLAFTLIDDRSKADIILTVVQRGIGNEAYGRRVDFQSYYGGASLEHTTMVASTFWVSTMMQVGPYKKEFTGTQTQDQNQLKFTWGAWGKCSDIIAKNVASWTKANAALMAYYKAPTGGAK